MTTTQLINLQETGIVSGANNIHVANERIAAARRATPEADRPKFRSYVRWIRSEGCYEWGWVLRGY